MNRRKFMGAYKRPFNPALELAVLQTRGRALVRPHLFRSFGSELTPETLGVK